MGYAWKKKKLGTRTHDLEGGYLLENILDILDQGRCSCLGYFLGSSSAYIHDISRTEKRIERFLQKSAHIRRVELLVIEFVIRVDDDLVSILTVGRDPESESDKRTFRDRADMFYESAEIKRIRRFLGTHISSDILSRSRSLILCCFWFFHGCRSCALLFFRLGNTRD